MEEEQSNVGKNIKNDDEVDSKSQTSSAENKSETKRSQEDDKSSTSPGKSSDTVVQNVGSHTGAIPKIPSQKIKQDVPSGSRSKDLDVSEDNDGAGPSEEDSMHHIFKKKADTNNLDALNFPKGQRSSYDDKNFLPLSIKMDTEHVLKIVVLGDFAVGKTAIIQQYTEQTFDHHYKVTIGSEFSTKQFRWDDLNIVRVHLWDIAGQERAGVVTRHFFRNAHAAILVCDVTRCKTFQNLPLWVENIRREVLQFDCSSVPIILFANKCDLMNPKIGPDQLNRCCVKYNIDAWFLTSAKNNINIEDGMTYAIKRALDVKKRADYYTMLESEPMEENIVLTPEVTTNTVRTRRARWRWRRCCRII